MNGEINLHRLLLQVFGNLYTYQFMITTFLISSRTSGISRGKRRLKMRSYPNSLIQVTNTASFLFLLLVVFEISDNSRGRSPKA